MQFRFIHTGDIHLDSPLRGLSGHGGAAAECIRTATRAAFSNLVDHAIQETVDFFIIAGDLYDGDWRDFQTGLFFIKEIARLKKENIPVFLIRGNHDAESQITKRLALPDNVRVFSSRKPETFVIETLGVALHGQSFPQRDVTDNLVPAYPNPVPGSFNIGILHTALGGRDGHANYAPCTLEELVNKGYDYWALAHVHQSAVLHQNPYVVFCGNLQGRHIRETGVKSAYLVTVEDGRVQGLLPVESDVVRWILITVPVGPGDSVNDLTTNIARAIERAAADGGGRLLACRIELTGRTALHDYILASEEQLLAEARAAALTLGEEAVWVDRLVLKTEPIRSESGKRPDAGDGVLQIIGEAANDIAFRTQLEAELGDLMRKFPFELRSGTDEGLLKSAASADYAAIAREASEYLTALLVAEEA
jgi:DNA repair protein SbcD/Mre11